MPTKPSPKRRARELYVCPACGHIDHDIQDGTGHWEQGTSEKWERDKSYSEWLLACNKCGKINEMKRVEHTEP